MKLSENIHLPFGRLTALSKVEGPFDKPFDKLRVDAEQFGLELTAERQCRSIEGLRYPYPSSLRAPIESGAKQSLKIPPCPPYAKGGLEGFVTRLPQRESLAMTG